MELSFHGANCLSLVTKTAKLVIDPQVPGIGFKTDKFDIIALTQALETANVKDGQLLIDTPGEYEARGISLKGIAARAYMDEPGKHTATMYRVDAAGVRAAMVGHIYPELDDEQLEALGTLDVLVVPVGGNGYTLDAEGAAQVIRAIEPRVVIPTHYADKEVKFDVPQNELKVFLDALGAPTQEEIRYKIKGVGDFPEALTVVILSRTS